MIDIPLTRELIYVCPECRVPVHRKVAGYDCHDCNRHYPILFGIADFRINSDKYLSLEEERAKAQKLSAFAQQSSFRDLVLEYYRITDDVPADMQTRFADYVLNGCARGELICESVGVRAGQHLLDVGCASGGTLVAAARRGAQPVGIDIALRWLVICAKRLEQQAIDVPLICADVQAHPLQSEQFEVCIAADLVEHVEDADEAMSQLVSTLEPDGKLYLSAANRYTLMPFPSAGLWGVGFLPKRRRSAYIKFRRGIDTLRYTSLVSPASVRKSILRASLEICDLSPLAIDAETGPVRERLVGFIHKLYTYLRVLPVIKSILLMIGPSFQVVARKPR